MAVWIASLILFSHLCCSSDHFLLVGTYSQGLSAAASGYHQAVIENKLLHNSLQELRGLLTTKTISWEYAIKLLSLTIISLQEIFVSFVELGHLSTWKENLQLIILVEMMVHWLFLILVTHKAPVKFSILTRFLVLMPLKVYLNLASNVLSF